MKLFFSMEAPHQTKQRTYETQVALQPHHFNKKSNKSQPLFPPPSPHIPTLSFPSYPYLHDVLDYSIGGAEEISPLGTEPVLDPLDPWGHSLLAQARDVPDPDGLVQRGRGHQVLRGVELGAHHVVAVTRQHAGHTQTVGGEESDIIHQNSERHAKLFSVKYVYHTCS